MNARSECVVPEHLRPGGVVDTIFMFHAACAGVPAAGLETDARIGRRRRHRDDRRHRRAASRPEAVGGAAAGRARPPRRAPAAAGAAAAGAAPAAARPCRRSRQPAGGVAARRACAAGGGGAGGRQPASVPAGAGARRGGARVRGRATPRTDRARERPATMCRRSRRKSTNDRHGASHRDDSSRRITLPRHSSGVRRASSACDRFRSTDPRTRRSRT